LSEKKQRVGLELGLSITKRNLESRMLSQRAALNGQQFKVGPALHGLPYAKQEFCKQDFMQHLLGSKSFFAMSSFPVDPTRLPCLALSSIRLPQSSDASAGDVVDLGKERTGVSRRNDINEP